MSYIYPQFSSCALPGLRIGGAGLGNLLFLYARSLVLAEEFQMKLIWPTWPSLKLGPWIRREKDKRFYADLFYNNAGAVGGIKKQWLLLTSQKKYGSKMKDSDWENLQPGDLVYYDSFKMNFDGLREHQAMISENISKCLKEKGAKAMKFDASNAINIHVRLGDFLKDSTALSEGNNNVRINIEWYVSVVQKLKTILGENTAFNVFSDGTDEELALLLSQPNVTRVTFGNSIADIIALSRAPLMIASGSSFSLWARFLGQCSSISFPAQMKDLVLQTPARGFEIELGAEEDFTEEIKNKIQNLFEK